MGKITPVLLSIIPGLGQLYNAKHKNSSNQFEKDIEVFKGIALFYLVIVFYFILHTFWLIVWIIGVVDAYRTYSN